MTRVTLVVALVVSALALPAAGGVGPAAATSTQTAAGPGQCGFPYQTTDATGTTVSLDAAPERVVTLNPSAAQTMWEIGAKERVVGLTKYADYLEGADSRANVSGATDIVVVEEVVALEPDLVLAPNATPAATVEQLRATGLTVYRFPEAQSLADVHAKTRTIGRLVGECEGAAETVASMRERVETARAASAGRERPDVLYAFFGYTAGRDTFVHAVIEAAGGNNVAADYGVDGYRQLNPEVVVEADPDWIIRNSNDPVLPDGAPFNSTTAVREGQVVVVPIEHLNQPAPRIVEGITTLAGHFYPEGYAAANATTDAGATEATTDPGTRTEARETTAPGSTSETMTSETTWTTGQPGFGLLAGLLALLGALLATRVVR